MEWWIRKWNEWNKQFYTAHKHKYVAYNINNDNNIRLETKSCRIS